MLPWSSHQSLFVAVKLIGNLFVITIMILMAKHCYFTVITMFTMHYLEQLGADYRHSSLYK